MVLAVDIDDVLYPFADTAIDYVAKVSGHSVTHLELFGDQKYTASGLSDREFNRLVRQYHHLESNIEHKPIPGSAEVLSKLSSDNRIYLVTSRSKGMRDITEKWLNRHLSLVKIEDLIFVGNHWTGDVVETKADTCRRLGAKYLIEDQPRYVELFNNHKTDAILFGMYPWNQNHKHSLRAEGWSQVYEIVS